MQPQDWVRLRCVVGAEEADLVVDIFWQQGTAGVEQLGAGEAVEFIAGFDSRDGAEEARRQLHHLGIEARLEEIQDDGLDAWREHAEAVHADPFWIVPAWLSAPAEADPAKVLLVEPGRTFGSGSHPTTRLVTQMLARYVRSGDRVLDVGTGSGVLALAASRLGASSVTAIDIDEASPEVVRVNARANGATNIAASNLSLDAIASDQTDGAFDVVAANLLAPTIEELAAGLRSVVRTHGTLIVSGLLEERWVHGVKPLEPLQPIEVVTADGWAAVALR